MLHNRYKIPGGEDVSTEVEARLLRSMGIEVDTFFVSNDKVDEYNKIDLAINTVWSRRYYKEIQHKVKKEKYDIVHIQNFFPLLSPSILYAIQNAGAKVVMSIRNYRLICPNALMFTNDAICTRCVGKTFPFSGVVHKCYKKSYAASATTFAMLSIHNLLNTWNKKIDAFICISEFVKSKLVQGGLNENQMFVKYNFVDTQEEPNFGPGDYYIYVGRLSIEKGIDVLMNAFENSNRKLIIIGNGPLKDEVVAKCSTNRNIQYLGQTSLSETYKSIALAKALIFPSKWHEPFGRTIVEAFAHGTPVIGSACGGVTELIQDGYNGYLFNPFKDEALELAMSKFESSSVDETIRKQAYSTYLEKFSPSVNYKQLLEIYNTVLSGNALAHEAVPTA